ncbi:hypothetical protein Esti_004271 [Eimeria stiedai]
MRLEAGIRGLFAGIAAAAAASHSGAAGESGALPPLAAFVQQQREQEQQQHQQQHQEKHQVHTAEFLTPETSSDPLRHEGDTSATSSGCTSRKESCQSTSADKCSSHEGSGADACSINKSAAGSSFELSPGDDTVAVSAAAAGELLRRISSCGDFHLDAQGCASVGRCRHFPLDLQQQQQQQYQQPQQHKQQQQGLCLLEKVYLEELANNNCALEPRSTLLAVAKDLHELGAVGLDASVLHAARSSTNTSSQALCRLVTHAAAASASAFEALVSLLTKLAAPQQLHQQQAASSTEQQKHQQLPPHRQLWQQQQQQQKPWRVLRRWAKLRRLLSA